MEADIIQILVQGGATGIVIALLVYLWKRDVMYNKTMNNHLQHQTDADIKLAEAITELKEAVRGCPTNYKHKV